MVSISSTRNEVVTVLGVSTRLREPCERLAGPANAPRVLRFGRKAKQFSGVLSNTSHPLTGRPAHGDLTQSRSGSAPSNAGCPVIEQGQIGPCGPARGGDAPPAQQTFSYFSPSQN